MPAKKKAKTTYCLKPGYAYHLESGDNWQHSGGGAWDTVMVSSDVARDARYVGERWIDSDKMAVFKTLEGYFAQTAVFARCAPKSGKKRHGSGGSISVLVWDGRVGSSARRYVSRSARDLPEAVEIARREGLNAAFEVDGEVVGSWSPQSGARIVAGYHHITGKPTRGGGVLGGKKRHGSADKRKRVAWMSLSQDARRFMNDLLTMPKYHGGLQGNATQNELDRLGLIEVIYGYKTDASGTPRDFVKLTEKGKRYLKDAEYKKWDRDPLGMEKLAAEVKALLK